MAQMVEFPVTRRYPWINDVAVFLVREIRAKAQGKPVSGIAVAKVRSEVRCNRRSRVHHVDADVAIADTNADKTVDGSKLPAERTFRFRNAETSLRHYRLTIVTPNSVRTSSIGFATVRGKGRNQIRNEFPELPALSTDDSRSEPKHTCLRRYCPVGGGSVLARIYRNALKSQLYKVFWDRALLVQRRRMSWRIRFIFKNDAGRPRMCPRKCVY